MTASEGDRTPSDASNDVPTVEVTDIPPLSEATVEVGLQGGKFGIKGDVAPGKLARLAFAPAFSLLGLIGLVALLLADRVVAGVAVCILAQLLAVVWWFVTGRS